MTAEAMLARTRKLNPTLDLAISNTGNAIGVWNDELSRYQSCLLAFNIEGPEKQWISTNQEILVDGKPDQYTKGA